MKTKRITAGPDTDVSYKWISALATASEAYRRGYKRGIRSERTRVVAIVKKVLIQSTVLEILLRHIRRGKS